MEKWFKNHTFITFLVVAIASILTFAFTTFATQKTLDEKIANVKETAFENKSWLEKRLDRIEEKIDKLTNSQ
jgi:hypothetical protein